MEPKNEQELLDRAKALTGHTLGEIAASLSLSVPPDLKRDKGWVGNLIERYLGAIAGSKPQQDFAHLGIELKTLPVDSTGFPLETTFVCVAPLLDNCGVVWESSHVRYKLQKVLWIPVEGTRALPLPQRRVGIPILWSPSAEEDHALKQDWQELMELIALGHIQHITARHGVYLQLRPKAANGRALTDAIDEQGQRIQTRPRGFYLKKSFTAAILRNYLTTITRNAD